MLHTIANYKRFSSVRNKEQRRQIAEILQSFHDNQSLQDIATRLNKSQNFAIGSSSPWRKDDVLQVVKYYGNERLTKLLNPIPAATYKNQFLGAVVACWAVLALSVGLSHKYPDSTSPAQWVPAQINVLAGQVEKIKPKVSI